MNTVSVQPQPILGSMLGGHNTNGETTTFSCTGLHVLNYTLDGSPHYRWRLCNFHGAELSLGWEIGDENTGGIQASVVE